MTRGTKALVVTSIGVSMSALDTTIVNVARDTIGRSFNASESAVSWVLSGYSIVFAAVLLTAGRIADRYGRKKIYTVGLLAFITASGLCALAPTLPILIAARALQAVGGALLSPAALALVLPEFPLENRSAAIAVWGAIGSIGAGAGPVLGSLLLRAFGWRSAFFINLPVGLVAFVLGRKLLHESKDEAATGIPDPVSIVAGVGSVGILALAITKGNEWGYLSPRSTVCFIAAAALLPLFVWRCRTAKLPVLDLRLFKQRAFAVGNVSVLFFGLPFYGQLVGNITFLQRTWHYSVLGSGLASVPPPVIAFLTSRAAGRWCDRIGHRLVAIPGAVILALSLFLHAAFDPVTPAYWRTYGPFSLLTGFGLGILISTLQSSACKYLPRDRFAMGSAFFTTIRQLGSALAIAITVALLTRPALGVMHNARTAWVVQGASSLMVGVLMVTLYRPPSTSDDVGQGMAALPTNHIA